MDVNHVRKIRIIGSVGSGKTTLAKVLSSRLGIPFYELDNVVWRRNEERDIRRTEKERGEYLSSIIATDAWIIEGVHYEWVLNSFEYADLIIFLDTNYSTRIYRIIKRFILQIFRLEKSNYKPTLKIFCNMFIWNAHFESIDKREIVRILASYDGKVIYVKNRSQRKKIFT